MQTLFNNLSALPKPSLDDPKPLVLYHGRNCPDGFGSALAAWLFYEGKVQLCGLDHGDVNNIEQLEKHCASEIEGRYVYMLDFAFNPEITRALAERAARLIVLDHHKSAAQNFSDPELLQDWAELEGRLFLHFEMKKSGARLAWEYFQPQRPVPALIRYIEDRDIWKWEFAQSAAFLSALDMEPQEFPRWAEIADFGDQEEIAFIERGGVMNEKFQKLCADIAQNAQPVKVNGIEGLMVNCPGLFHSQVGDILARKSGSFALMWHASSDTETKKGGVKVGLRSRSSFDCIPLARSFGGGGHAQACGFRIENERLIELLSGEIQA